MRTLLERGAQIDSRDGQGRTALLIAMHGNHVDAARVLIDAGADVNAKDAIQDSPYLYAGARGHLDILRMTLAHGADLRSTNRYRGTALIPAAERGHVDTVRTLIDAGVDVDHVNRLGWTALLEAIMLGDGSERYVRIVQLLVAGTRTSIWPIPTARRRCSARQRGYGAIERVLVAAGRGRAERCKRAAIRPIRPDRDEAPSTTRRGFSRWSEAVCPSGRQLPRPPSLQPAADLVEDDSERRVIPGGNLPGG